MENEDQENEDNNEDKKSEVSDDENGPIYNPKNLPLGWSPYFI
jgi:hypothetical protein